jgi:hypothetical protein
MGIPGIIEVVITTMELARRVLDELMGPERNKMPNEKGSFGVRFTDREVSNQSLELSCFFF